MFGVTNKPVEGDPRVAKALDQIGIRYEIDGTGDYKVGMKLDDERTQLAFIRSNTFEYGGVELREIFSVGLNSTGPFDARTANLLLEQNTRVKVGAWGVSRSEDDCYAIFSAHVGAELSGDALRAVLVGVLETADEMEKRLSGRDDF